MERRGGSTLTILVGAELTKDKRPQAEGRVGVTRTGDKKTALLTQLSIANTYLGNCHDASCIYLAT